jgi:hypothetical protein
MKTWTEKAVARHGARKIGLAVAMLMTSMGVIAAHERYPSGADLYYHAYLFYEHHSIAPSRRDRFRFDRSGTRGRMGLGADTAHPEGPGNVSD